MLPIQIDGVRVEDYVRTNRGEIYNLRSWVDSENARCVNSWKSGQSLIDELKLFVENRTDEISEQLDLLVAEISTIQANIGNLVTELSSLSQSLSSAEGLISATANQVGILNVMYEYQRGHQTYYTLTQTTWPAGVILTDSVQAFTPSLMTQPVYWYNLLGLEGNSNVSVITGNGTLSATTSWSPASTIFVTPSLSISPTYWTVPSPFVATTATSISTMASRVWIRYRFTVTISLLSVSEISLNQLVCTLDGVTEPRLSMRITGKIWMKSEAGSERLHTFDQSRIFSPTNAVYNGLQLSGSADIVVIFNINTTTTATPDTGTRVSCHQYIPINEYYSSSRFRISGEQFVKA